MSKRVIRMPSARLPFLDLLSSGRAGLRGSTGFSGVQLEQIRRTVARTPEVMIKVTGGGKASWRCRSAPVLHQPARGARDRD